MGMLNHLQRKQTHEKTCKMHIHERWREGGSIHYFHYIYEHSWDCVHDINAVICVMICKKHPCAIKTWTLDLQITCVNDKLCITLIYIKISHCMFICHCICFQSPCPRLVLLLCLWVNIQQDWVWENVYNFPFLCKTTKANGNFLKISHSKSL